MKLSQSEKRDRRYRYSVWLGTLMPILFTLLRLTLTDGLRDSRTGRFVASGVLVAVLAAAVAALFILAPRGGSPRVDVRGKGATLLSVGALCAGGLIGLEGLWDVVRFFAYGELPAPAVSITSSVTLAVSVLSLISAVAAGAVLILFGWQVAQEGGTRIGMRSGTMLVPVLWMWLRLARYEMSYASAISLDKSIYDFAMFALELLFLFKLARFVSGIGKTRPGTLLAYAMATAVTAFSGPLTRFGMYLLGDTQAYLTSRLAGLADLAVGILALCFGWALYLTRNSLRSYESPVIESSTDGLLFDDSVRVKRQ